MNQYVEEFSTYLTEVKKASVNTCLSYMRDITQFETHLTANGIRNILEATPDDIASYIASLDHAGKSDSTILRATAALKSFYNYMILCGYIESTPIKAEVKRRKEKHVPEGKKMGCRSKQGVALAVTRRIGWESAGELFSRQAARWEVVCKAPFHNVAARDGG